MSRRIVLIRHGDEPNDDRVVTYFRSRNVEPEIARPFAGERLDEADDNVAGCVVYGGPYDVFDTQTHSSLSSEHRWIEQCIAKDIPTLGTSSCRP